MSEETSEELEASAPDPGEAVGKVSGEESEDAEEAPEAPSGDELEDAEEVEPPELDEVAAVGVEFVGGLMEAAGVEAEVGSRIEADSVWIEVSGEDLGTMIGRRGQTLESIQEIARTAVQRRFRSRVRLQVDVEGYKDRRRQSLADYARSIAERAKERGTEIELEPMSAYERKIVHDAVAEVDGATSFSEGDEPNRKVVVRGE
jgi:spoIIIJ-associated protein